MKAGAAAVASATATAVVVVAGAVVGVTSVMTMVASLKPHSLPSTVTV